MHGASRGVKTPPHLKGADGLRLLCMMEIKMTKQQFIKDIMDKITVHEKVGQLNQCGNSIYNDDYIDNSDEWYQKIIPGFIAEKLDKLLPIVVSHDENGIRNGWKEKAIIPLMLKLIQEQHIKIESLIQQNISLEGRIAILDQIVNQLSSQVNQLINQITGGQTC